MIRQILLCFTVMFTATFIVKGQKLPAIQAGSKQAPPDIKIDGRLTEWKDAALQAYNPHNRIYYTISNDDNCVYFAIAGKDNTANTKFLSGGLIITISHYSDKKIRAKAADNVVLTFPMPQDRKTISGIMAPMRAEEKIYANPRQNSAKIDSIQSLANERLIATLKEIKVMGIKEMAEPEISVYNAVGIKVAARFTARQLIYELAVPIKYLGLPAGNPVKFSYNIKLPGTVELGPGGRPVNLSIPRPMLNGVESLPDLDSEYAYNPTDFWGEYTLIKNNN